MAPPGSPRTPAERAQLLALTGCIIIAMITVLAIAVLVMSWDDLVVIFRRLADG
jgi:hypothetical protein